MSGQDVRDILKIVLVILAASAAFIGANTSDPEIRLWAGALAAGLSPALLILHPPGRPQQSLTPEELARVRAAMTTMDDDEDDERPPQAVRVVPRVQV